MISLRHEGQLIQKKARPLIELFIAVAKPINAVIKLALVRTIRGEKGQDSPLL